MVSSGHMPLAPQIPCPKGRGTAREVQGPGGSALTFWWYSGRNLKVGGQELVLSLLCPDVLCDLGRVIFLFSTSCKIFPSGPSPLSSLWVPLPRMAGRPRACLWWGESGLADSCSAVGSSAGQDWRWPPSARLLSPKDLGRRLPQL